MEITNEIKAKVFGQYLGQKMSYGHIVNGEIISKIEHGVLRDDIKLILKPILAITDEDAIKVAKMIISPINYSRLDYKITRHNTSVEVKLDNSHFEDSVFIGNSGNVWTTVKHPRYGNEVFQFFADRGYDQKQMLLNNQTLHEVGLAIYE